MTDLSTLAKLPDVKSAVLGDLGGGYRDAYREQDGETIAAVMGFVSSALTQVGDELGIGALRRIAVAAEPVACVVVVQEDAVLTASIEPARSLAAVEKALDTAAHEKV
jgi:predicted regulator of Ras-like GTPase activity (Roadblock/LC7/MglB family)